MGDDRSLKDRVASRIELYVMLAIMGVRACDSKEEFEQLLKPLCASAADAIVDQVIEDLLPKEEKVDS